MNCAYKSGDYMFSYNINQKDSKIFVTIPEKIKYNFKFLNGITELMEKSMNSKCDKVYLSCSSSSIDFNKMGAAYLYNTLIFLAKWKVVYVDRELSQLLHEQVTHTDGSKFQKIDLQNSLKPEQQCYCFKDDKAVNKTVQILVNFITENNLVLELEDAKEFLITTIGEIFSNAFNHSDENKVYFMYDIEVHEGRVFLVINITDYGKTIIGNVQEYQKKVYKKELSPKESIVWAMQNGHTTRVGSGGYGLPTLVDYVKEINGELLIFSDSCMYALKGTIENILDSKGIFIGTSVSMKIPLYDTTKVLVCDKKSNHITSINLDQI